MPYTFTPLRQIERLYGSILRAAALLARIGEANERQEQLIVDSGNKISVAVSAAKDAVVERIGISSELRNLSSTFEEAGARIRLLTSGEFAQQLKRLQADLAANLPGNPACHGWSSYSQCDEDGIIRECLQRIAQVMPLSKTFIEVGCADGLENNTHQLLLDGFIGCWIDGDEDKIRFVQRELGALQTPALMVQHAFVTMESIQDVVTKCRSFLVTDDVDFLSFDIDGNDTHLVRSTLTLIQPKLICVEYNAKFRPPTRVEMSNSSSHRWGGDDYFSASLQTWVDLLDGYALVSCNLSGVNAFFVRRDLANVFTRSTVEELYQPPRYWLAGNGAGHRSSLKWLRQTVYSPQVNRPWVIEARVPHLPSFEFEIHRKADQYVSADLARESIWEPLETDVFRRICRPGDFVLDIGANIGWYSTLAAKMLGREGRLIAFEPDPDNFELLTRNIARCTNTPAIELRHEAVGDSRGKVQLFLPETNLGDHRIFDDGTKRPSIEVPLDNLDSILKNEARLPDIVKSDTQGSEARILRGASGLFSSGWRPVLLLEFWPFGLSGSGNSPADLWDRLMEFGYQMFEVSESNPRLTTLTEAHIKVRLSTNITAASGGFINILAMPAGTDRIESLVDLID